MKPSIKDELIFGILNRLEHGERCLDIRKSILDNDQKVSDEEYQLACQIFEETSKAYFKLGFEACQTLFTNDVA